MTDRISRKDFLDALFLSYMKNCGGFIMVRSVSPNELKTSTRYFPNTETLSREQYADDYNVFFGVCPRQRMKPGKEHIRHITAVWAGLDIGPDGYSGKERHFASEKQALAALKDFPLEPSIVVRSGRGMHLYWLLDNLEPVTDTDVDRVEKTLRRISDYFQCKPEVGIDGVLRLPGTANAKDPVQTKPCYVEHMDATRRYGLEDFQSLDLRIFIPSKRPPKPFQLPPLPQPRVRVIRNPESWSFQQDEPVVTVISTDSGITETDTPPSPEGRPDLTDRSMEKLTERFLEAFSEEMLDRLADKIVDRLAAKFGGINRKQ
ncbi:MAG: hypothetical protein RDU20_12040 [Desulfomonilaceae bacterium]|nr:hypothetical protein [Desulfomonilaceae bacterium]